MIKSQDCIILVKILANPGVNWSQRQLANILFISLAEVNAGIKRLCEARLLRKDKQGQLFPNKDAASEFLVSSIKFLFPGKLGEFTRGIPTSVAAPLFHNKIALGEDPIPVWPYATGKSKGVALNPIHPTAPKSVNEHPDQMFYEILILIDVIRSGRARERNMAIKLLKQRLENA